MIRDIREFKRRIQQCKVNCKKCTNEFKLRDLTDVEIKWEQFDLCPACAKKQRQAIINNPEILINALNTLENLYARLYSISNKTK